MRTHTATTQNAAPPIRRITLSGLARDALAEFDGDVSAAKNHLVSRLESERWLLEAVADQAISEAVNTFVQAGHRQDRAAIVRSAPKAKINFGKVTKALKNTHQRMFLDFPLAGGVKLRDATKEQVEAQVRSYTSQGETLLHRARWLERIARMVKPGQVVGKAVNEAKAMKLFQETANV